MVVLEFLFSAWCFSDVVWHSSSCDPLHRLVGERSLLVDGVSVELGIATVRYVAFWFEEATSTLSRSGRDRVTATFSSGFHHALWEVTTDSVSPSDGDNLCVAFSDKEGLGDMFGVSFCCDSIFLAPVMFLARYYPSLSPGARHLRACPRDRLLLLPEPPVSAHLFEGVLRAAGELESRTLSFWVFEPVGGSVDGRILGGSRGSGHRGRYNGVRSAGCLVQHLVDRASGSTPGARCPTSDTPRLASDVRCPAPDIRGPAANIRSRRPTLNVRNRDPAEEELPPCTRIIGRKRVATLQATGESAFSSPFYTSCQKRRCRRSPPEALNHLELLPQDILVHILYFVNHGDLKQLLFVSKAIHDAALIAKAHHFAFRTPTPKLTFKGDSREEIADVCDSHETPNAPKRISRSRLRVKDLSSIAVALFASSDDL
ncbi:hypothetical protein Taro_049076 [Colocasia esculenta]|uniref:F-box domain-containing protein n=1 Tax=Colocasia esculenta TaxID=4460 RepID=A0A843X9S4_COLES|nr:hypothetical protein [Colocasia esculenta]